jgi:hypothetical protein
LDAKIINKKETDKKKQKKLSEYLYTFLFFLWYFAQFALPLPTETKMKE